MNIYKLLMLLTLASALSAVSAAKADAGTPQQGDSWVTAKVKIALFADPRVKGREINVETKAGEVMLRGKVDSDDAKAASGEIAKSVQGATTVKNELQVVAPSKRAAVDDGDDAVLARVKTALRKTRYAHIGIKVNAGVVTLNGNAKSWTTAAGASVKAWLVGGVKSVKNDITVAE